MFENRYLRLGGSTLAIATIIALITNWIRFEVNQTNVGLYYWTGYPLRVFEVAGSQSSFHLLPFLGNILIWLVPAAGVVYLFHWFMHRHGK